MRRTRRATTGLLLWTTAAIVAGFGAVQGQAQAPVNSPNASWKPPSDEQRCPSKWGAGDQLGSANHMKPENVLRAARLIRTGQTFELGHVLERGMPLLGNRMWDVNASHSGTTPRPGVPGGLEETVVTALGQVGTQFDGFAHQHIGGSFYNCFKMQDVATASGMTKLGMETVGTQMSRGVLIDVAALKGVEMLGDAYVITPADLQQALARSRLTLQPGDAVLINTGWGKLWRTDASKFVRSSPGLGIAAEEWLVTQDPMLVGSDNCCIEVRPAGVGALIHTYFLAVNGIHLVENLKLDELAAAGATEFAFVVQPLKIWGGTGSTVAPTAIR